MNDSLGDRMKRNYENPSRFFLTRRVPVIIRVDGVAFHTLTQKMQKPFSGKFIWCMVEAAKRLAMDMQGFRLAYVQSDEASFFLTDYSELTTEPWFGYCKSKLESVSASKMTAEFNLHADDCELHNEWRSELAYTPRISASFDARAFNIPKEEVANYFLWRAIDWRRNSLQMFARAHFSHKELHNKSSRDIHEMLHALGINWTKDCTPQQRNGTWIYRGGNGMAECHTIQPRYSEIAGIWALRTSVEPELHEAS